MNWYERLLRHKVLWEERLLIRQRKELLHWIEAQEVIPNESVIFALADDGSDIFALELAHSALDEERASHSEIPEDNVDWGRATTALAELNAAMDAVAKSGNIQNVESLSWIRRQFPGNDSPLAGNRFDREEEINLIEKLYTMGAVSVTVAIPQVENEKILAFIHIDTLHVELPDDPKIRKKLLSVLKKEMQDQGLWSDHDQAVIDDRNVKTVIMWWKSGARMK